MAVASLLPEVVKKLLEKKAGLDSLDRYGNNLMHKLMINYDKKCRSAEKIFEMLMKSEISVGKRNKKNHTPFSLAVLFKNKRGIQKILE